MQMAWEPRSAIEIVTHFRERRENQQLQALREQARELRQRLEQSEARLAEERRQHSLARAENERLLAHHADSVVSLASVDREKYSGRRVIAAVSAAHKVSVATLLSRSRYSAHVIARFHAVHILSTMRPDLTLPGLGRIMGGRDHTSIMNARKRWPLYAPLCALEILKVKEALERDGETHRGPHEVPFR